MNDFNNLTTIFEFTMKYNIDTSETGLLPWYGVPATYNLHFSRREKRRNKEARSAQRKGEELGHLQDRRDLFQSSQCGPCPHVEADGLWQCLYLLPQAG